MSKWKPIDEMPRTLDTMRFRYHSTNLTFKGWRGHSGQFWRNNPGEGRDEIIAALPVPDPDEWKRIPEKKPKKSKWVRVEDRKPGQTVTVALWDGKDTYAGFYMSHHEQFFLAMDHRELRGITHWRPLPKGPQDE